ncbi:MAG: DUF3792 family protein [Acidimicrobiia bacterium]
MPPVEPRALLRGAGVSTAVCLPLALVSAAVVDEDDPSGWAVPLFFATLLGLVAGGWVASRSATVSPLVTGALAGLVAFVAVQAVGVAVRLAGDDGIGWSSIVFTALLAYGCGLTGAVLAERRRRRESP